FSHLGIDRRFTCMTRDDVQFDVCGDACAAWMYTPVVAGPADARAVVVMAHGLSGTRRDGLGSVAERVGRHGGFGRVVDPRGVGEVCEPARQLQDWAQAIAFARRWPGVDPDRVVTFGSSMGGGNALAAAARDQRVAAAISQVPFLNMVRQVYRASPKVMARM